MRIVAGTHKGARLAAPKGMNTRPTSDRVRESLFNILTHSLDDFSLDEVRVLDLFAGTGALGLEALSRGAAFALFIDNDPEARGAQRDNIETLELTGKTRLFRRDARKLGDAGNLGQFGLVFLDPPYGKGLADPTLAGLKAGGWLEEGAAIIIEEETGAEINPPHGFTLETQRSYGDTAISIYRYFTSIS